MTHLDLISAAVIACLFGVGVYLLMQRSLMRVLLGFVVLGHGANLLLLFAGGAPGRPPITEGGSDPDPAAYADPLPQAMALTAIVITFGVTAFLLALAYRAFRLSGHDEVRDDVEDQRLGSREERS
ncbi:Na(+)/H(+) antiporter subunit C [Saccharothrix isguenensis]